MKKFICLVLAVWLVAAMGSYALADTVDQVNGSSTTLTGTIKATQLKVTMPGGGISFGIDPTVDAKTPTTQITGCPDFTISNGSVVPVYAKIASVTTDSTSGVRLVQKESSLGGEGNDRTVMLGFKAVDAITDFNTEADWLSTDNLATHYTLDGNGGLIAAGGTMNLTVYGQLQQGWKAEETFVVTPVIIISATPFVS